MANSRRGHKIQRDFQSRILKRIPIERMVKSRDELLYEILYQLGLDELDPASQMQAIIAAINYANVIDACAADDELRESDYKLQDRVYQQLQSLKKSTPPQDNQSNDLQAQLSAILEGR